jgi:hypothetical protein
MVTTETGIRNYPITDRYHPKNVPVKKISLPNSGIWVCPDFFRAREVSFNANQGPFNGGIASLKVKLVADEDWDTIWLYSGEKHTMEVAEIDVGGGTAIDIVVYAY